MAVVAGDAVGAKPLGHLGEGFLAAPGATHAALRIDDDAGRLDQLLRQDRREPEQRRSRITTRCRDQPRAHELDAVPFGLPIYRSSDQLRNGVLAVPALVNFEV